MINTNTDKEIILNTIDTEIKIRFVKKKFIEIIKKDYSKKRVKFDYTLIEKENLNKFLEFLK